MSPKPKKQWTSTPQGKAWAHEYYLKNKERIREKQKIYRQSEEFKEKNRENMRVWRKLNPEKHNAANKRWRERRKLREEQNAKEKEN